MTDDLPARSRSRRGARSLRSRRGGAALEFALCVPFVFLVLGVTVELGQFILRHQDLRRAARDGCRVGAATLEGPSGNGASLRAAAEAHSREILEQVGMPCDAGCTLVTSWAEEADGFSYLTVTVQIPYEPLTGLVPGMSGRPMRGRFTMLTQHQPE